jgi:hypothetical protein
VAKQFNQRPGLDYKETFSLVVKPVTIHTVLTIAIMQGWSLRQLNVNNVFLHEHLTEKVYMKQPPGFKSPEKPSHVCCLTKAITSTSCLVFCSQTGTIRIWFHQC